ncbi:MAG: YihY/virulence factor BrkB family protein [Acidimicrobiales bacterium]|nr:YihY/virulence factor BrkB family protein [Acidimicrobiales bacterium]
MAVHRHLDRLEDVARRRDVGRRRDTAALVAVGTTRRFVEVRVTGLAAEMTYYLLLSIIPLLTALGASLGLLGGILGDDAVDQLEDGLTDTVRRVLSADLSEDLIVPLIRDLLAAERTGLAIGSLAVSLWLGGRIFRAAIRALDDAYGVEDRRTLPVLFGLSVAFVVGAVATVTIVLAMAELGPFLGASSHLTDQIGGGGVLDAVWRVARWGVAAAAGVAFLVWLYRVGPNVDNTWRECLPGALVALVGLAAVVVGFRAYLVVAGPGDVDVATGDQAVQVVGRFLGTVLASVLLLWGSCIVVLLGGVVNAELSRTGSRRSGDLSPPSPPPGPPADRTGPS